MKTKRSYRYHIVDVFTETPLEGNALAVFPQAEGIDDRTMLKIARELNLSETTFVFPTTRKDCVASVRIFTPAKEMIFAGHPTVGTAFVLLQLGIVPTNATKFSLEEKIGPVPVSVDSAERPMIWLSTPQIATGRTYDRALCAKLLGLSLDDLLEISPQFLSAGNPTIFIALRTQDAVDRAWLDLQGLQVLKGSDKEPTCAFVFAPTKAGAYSRMFAPEYGISEDPATGSSTGPLAAFMMHHRLVANLSGTRFISEQGTKMGRRSLLHVHLRGQNGSDGIEVGGHVTPVGEATMYL